MKYRIGLDIGITSVGWAVLLNDDQDEPFRIEDLGVRIFEAAEVPKTGASLAAPRREARCTRRRLRRRRHRLERMKALLEREHVIDTKAFMERYYQKNLPNVYQLRYEALERKLKQEEFAQILLHIAKHRGFKSTRKSETQDKEGGAVLSATKKNQELMKEKGYRTIGEMIFLDEEFKISAPWSPAGVLLAPRNKAGNYKHTVLRDLLLEEVKLIFEKQREFGNPAASKELEEACIEIMMGQRSFDQGPGYPSPYAGDLIEKMVGYCTFEREERRASKAAFTSERFVLLQKVNHIRLLDADRRSIELSPEQRHAVVFLAYSKNKVTYADIRKKLELPESIRFKGLNYAAQQEKKGETETKTQFVSLQWFHELKKALKDVKLETLTEEKIQQLDQIAACLTLYKSDDSRREKLQEFGLSEEQTEALLSLNPSKFLHLSIKAMKKMLPFLEEGFTYDKACAAAGYSFRGEENEQKSVLLRGDTVNQVLEEIPNPVVKRSVSQTIKVLNAIIRKYGSPQAVSIELARDMAKGFEERKKIEKEMQKNEKVNEAVKAQLQEYGCKNPTGLDIVKFKLWQEQDGICMYSGQPIPVTSLAEAEVDHIIPYSISFDDSYTNKVLVKAICNREKGNRLPYEYFGGKTERWDKFEQLVKSHIRNYKKQLKLLKTELSEEEKEDFKTRNLTDTKYITTIVYNLIRNQLYLEPYTSKDKIKKVYAVNGTVTDYLKKRWGMPKKDRSIDLHHAMDAVVVACCTDGMIQKISEAVKIRERAFMKKDSPVDAVTGERMTREDWDNKYGAVIPHPWKDFRKEALIRLSSDPMRFSQDLRQMGYPYQKRVEPIFVSRMSKHKVTGAGHADTIRSPRHFKEEGIVLTKTNLCDLKLTQDGEIAGYYAPESDKLLYQALKDRLLDFHGDAKAAFQEPFYKPKSDGSRGPLVRKVKIYQKQTLGVLLNHGTGIAENGNGSMVRVDIFCEDGKYYFVPIYTPDTKKKELPNLAVKGGKPYAEWKPVKEEDFIFSLYSGDLFEFKYKKGGKKVKNSKGESLILKKSLVYYSGADICTASFLGKAHDRSFEFKSLGIQSLEYIRKYQVDVLGSVTEVKSEKRMKFR